MGRWWLPTGQTTSNATTVLIPGKRSKRRVRYAQAAHRSVGKMIKNLKKKRRIGAIKTTHACTQPAAHLNAKIRTKIFFGFTATPVVVLRRSLHMRRINLKKFQSAAVISFGPSSEAAPSTATPLVADYWIGSEKELTPCGPSNQICYNFICSSATKSPARLHLAVHPLALCAAFLRFFFAPPEKNC